MDQRLVAFQRLLSIMDDLREKCPWDKKQTFDSLRHLTIEETYELADSIIKEDWSGLEGEIGDLFLHLVFYSKIGQEQQLFDVTSVLNKVCDKLIHRHPHIYGDVKADTEEEVKSNWEKIKLQEGKQSILEGMPDSMPALVKAQRIQDKVKGVGFDWETKEQVWEKVQEELSELQVEVVQNNNQQAIEEELGDVLFSIVNYARFIGVNPDDALAKTNEKFKKRFQLMENLIADKSDKTITEMDLKEMDLYWEQAKSILKK